MTGGMARFYPLIFAPSPLLPPCCPPGISLSVCTPKAFLPFLSRNSESPPPFAPPARNCNVKAHRHVRSRGGGEDAKKGMPG
jgi:hypothetical protein